MPTPLFLKQLKQDNQKTKAIEIKLAAYLTNILKIIHPNDQFDSELAVETTGNNCSVLLISETHPRNPETRYRFSLHMNNNTLFNITLKADEDEAETLEFIKEFRLSLTEKANGLPLRLKVHPKNELMFIFSEDLKTCYQFLPCSSRAQEDTDSLIGIYSSIDHINAGIIYPSMLAPSQAYPSTTPGIKTDQNDRTSATIPLLEAGEEEEEEEEKKNDHNTPTTLEKKITPYNTLSSAVLPLAQHHLEQLTAEILFQIALAEFTAQNNGKTGCCSRQHSESDMLNALLAPGTDETRYPLWNKLIQAQTTMTLSMADIHINLPIIEAMKPQPNKDELITFGNFFLYVKDNNLAKPYLQSHHRVIELLLLLHSAATTHRKDKNIQKTTQEILNITEFKEWMRNGILKANTIPGEKRSSSLDDDDTNNTDGEKTQSRMTRSPHAEKGDRNVKRLPLSILNQMIQSSLFLSQQHNANTLDSHSSSKNRTPSRKPQETKEDLDIEKIVSQRAPIDPVLSTLLTLIHTEPHFQELKKGCREKIFCMPLPTPPLRPLDQGILKLLTSIRSRKTHAVFSILYIQEILRRCNKTPDFHITSPALTQEVTQAHHHLSQLKYVDPKNEGLTHVQNIATSVLRKLNSTNSSSLYNAHHLRTLCSLLLSAGATQHIDDQEEELGRKRNEPPRTTTGRGGDGDGGGNGNAKHQHDSTGNGI